MTTEDYLEALALLYLPLKSQQGIVMNVAPQSRRQRAPLAGGHCTQPRTGQWLAMAGGLQPVAAPHSPLETHTLLHSSPRQTHAGHSFVRTHGPYEGLEDKRGD